MTKKVRSAKGQTVDFDLLKIKQQMASNPAPVNVSDREKFIDRKLRKRRKAKAPYDPLANKDVNQQSEIDVSKADLVADNVDDEMNELDREAVMEEEYKKNLDKAESSSDNKKSNTTSGPKRVKKKTNE